MSRRRLLFLGGNGHASGRLQPARDALAAAGGTFDLAEVELPGFDGRTRAPTLDALLDALQRQLDGELLYATGIGALLALGVRARAGTPPLLLQAPVLWGLERRWMPRVMRLPPARAAAVRLFRLSAFQRRFWRRHLALPWDHAARAPFFDGYARCSAFADLFRWIGPRWLRELRASLLARPAALRDVAVWWGGRDTVVHPSELGAAEDALGARWPLRVFPEWGHYPMLEDPAGWVRAVAGAFDAQPPLTGGMNTTSSPSASAASKRS
jgi:hypothetical protein